MLRMATDLLLRSASRVQGIWMLEAEKLDNVLAAVVHAVGGRGEGRSVGASASMTAAVDDVGRHGGPGCAELAVTGRRARVRGGRVHRAVLRAAGISSVRGIHCR